MDYPATIVDQPARQLAVVRAETFPDGIGAAWKDLESRLASLKGRRFYGVTELHQGSLVYYAGLEPKDGDEVVALGLPTMEVPGGRYARVKLMDWMEKSSEIPGIFGQLFRDHETHPLNIAVEYYRSNSEVHLMVLLA